MALGFSAPQTDAERRELVRARLVAQGLADPQHDTPATVLAQHGAMQGQDLPGLISSIALRLDPVACAEWAAGQQNLNAEIDPRIARVLESFRAGEIVRGYPMRSTVFGQAAADAAWIRDLCVRPLVLRRIKPATVDQATVLTIELLKERERHLEPDLTKQQTELSAPLPGVSRQQLREHWEAHGIDTSQGVSYGIICHLIETGVLVYGAHNGSDNNLALAASWLPANSGLEQKFNGDRISATAELLRRYLHSHGPATLRDFAWWSKLPQRDIKPAFGQLGAAVEIWGTDAAGQPLYCRPGLRDEVATVESAALVTHLLPGFDEIVLGYEDRLTLLSAAEHQQLVPGNNGVFRRGMVYRGKMVATWKIEKEQLRLDPFAPPLSSAAVTAAERTFKRFPRI